MSAEPAGSEGVATEQIQALLGYGDAPDRWHYRSLQSACCDIRKPGGVS
jgi:hypothetical protein